MESEHVKLFVGGVSQETSDETLKLHFNKYGEVKRSEVIKDRMTGQGRGFGFVTFTDPSVVDKALQDQHIILGRTVEVKIARPKSEKHQNQQCQEWNCVNQRHNYGSSRNNYNGTCNTQFLNKKIFVGGLPLSLTKDEFKRYFESFGTIADVVVMFDKENNRSRGFGFVTFDSEGAVNNVLQKSFHELNNKLVEVKRAEPKDRDSRHMCTYDTYNTGLGWSVFGGFGGYPPYATCYSNFYVVNSYGVGALTKVYNGVGYETFSSVSHYYHRSPMFHGSHLLYPTYIFVDGWASGPNVTDCDGNYHGTVTSLFNNNSSGNDDDGDAEEPVSTSLHQFDDAMRLKFSGAENPKVADGHSRPYDSSYQGTATSILNKKSSENNGGGDAEEPVSKSLYRPDDVMSLEFNGAENHKGANGHSRHYNSSYQGDATSVLNKKSNENSGGGGDAEEPVSTGLDQPDDAMSLEFNGAENHKGADGHSRPYNSCYLGTATSVLNKISNENDGDGDAKEPISTSLHHPDEAMGLEFSDSESHKGPDGYSRPYNSSCPGTATSVLHKKSNESDDGGDAEVPVSTSLAQIDDALRLESYGAEIQKEADAQSRV